MRSKRVGSLEEADWMRQEIPMIVNGEAFEVAVRPGETLLEVLRDRLGLTGTKEGCDTGRCGACTVLIDGKATRSCLTLAVRARNKEITTIEGLADGEGLHPIQQAFVEHGAVQCGFCTPGMIMTSRAFLEENPNPSDEEIKQALTGNICRCTGYVKIVEAILGAAEKLRWVPLKGLNEFCCGRTIQHCPATAWRASRQKVPIF
jgi:carbon-monoxide dehydrogenase small subunit